MAQAKWYTFEVKPTRGLLSFPLDMLRYDCCYPLSECDASCLRFATEGVIETPVIIALTGHRVPTFQRWLSFGWEAYNLKLAKKQL